MIANAAGIKPIPSGHSGKHCFEQTLEEIRHHLDRQYQEQPKDEQDEKPDAPLLEQDDFSPNQVLRFMCMAAEQMRKSRKATVSRSDYFRKVDYLLISEGGLKPIPFNPNAKGGRAGWMRQHMRRFLTRNPELVDTVAGQPNMLVVLPQKP